MHHTPCDMLTCPCPPLLIVVVRTCWTRHQWNSTAAAVTAVTACSARASGSSATRPSPTQVACGWAAGAHPAALQPTVSYQVQRARSKVPLHSSTDSPGSSWLSNRCSCQILLMNSRVSASDSGCPHPGRSRVAQETSAQQWLWTAHQAAASSRSKHHSKQQACSMRISTSLMGLTFPVHSAVQSCSIAAQHSGSGNRCLRPWLARHQHGSQRLPGCSQRLMRLQDTVLGAVTASLDWSSATVGSWSQLQECQSR